MIRSLSTEWSVADLGKRRQQLDNDSDTKIDQALRLHICVCVCLHILYVRIYAVFVNLS